MLKQVVGGLYLPCYICLNQCSWSAGSFCSDTGLLVVRYNLGNTASFESFTKEDIAGKILATNIQKTDSKYIEKIDYLKVKEVGQC